MSIAQINNNYTSHPKKRESLSHGFKDQSTEAQILGTDRIWRAKEDATKENEGGIA